MVSWGGVCNCPRGGSRHALHCGRGRGQRQRRDEKAPRRSFSPLLLAGPLARFRAALSARSLDRPTHSLALARARPFPLTHTKHTETFEDKRRRRRASKAQSEFSKRKKDGAFSGFFTPPGQGTKSMFLLLLIPSFLLFPFETPILPFPFAFHLRLWAPLRSLRRRASLDPERGDRQGSRPPSDPETQKKEKGKQGRGGGKKSSQRREKGSSLFRASLRVSSPSAGSWRQSLARLSSLASRSEAEERAFAPSLFHLPSLSFSLPPPSYQDPPPTSSFSSLSFSPSFSPLSLSLARSLSPWPSPPNEKQATSHASAGPPSSTPSSSGPSTRSAGPPQRRLPRSCAG